MGWDQGSGCESKGEEAVTRFKEKAARRAFGIGRFLAWFRGGCCCCDEWRENAYAASNVDLLF